MQADPAGLPATHPLRGEQRRQQILAAAERVFAEDGYHATTMRALAQRAEVKLALVQYHFGTKLALFTAIFERRQYVNDERLRLLGEIPDLSAPSALEDIVAALIGPSLQLHDHPDDVWFARLVLRETSDPSNHQRPVMRRFFDPMAREFVAALETALPGKPSDFYVWGYLFTVGALTQSVNDARAYDLDPRVGSASKNSLLYRYVVAALRDG